MTTAVLQNKVVRNGTGRFESHTERAELPGATQFSMQRASRKSLDWAERGRIKFLRSKCSESRACLGLDPPRRPANLQTDAQSLASWDPSIHDQAGRATRLLEPREGQSSSPQMAVEATGHEVDSQGRFSGDASQTLLIERALLNAEDEERALQRQAWEDEAAALEKRAAALKQSIETVQGFLYYKYLGRSVPTKPLHFGQDWTPSNR